MNSEQVVIATGTVGCGLDGVYGLQYTMRGQKECGGGLFYCMVIVCDSFIVEDIVVWAFQSHLVTLSFIRYVKRSTICILSKCIGITVLIINIINTII